MERLFPDPAPVQLAAQLDTLELGSRADGERPFLYTNFAATVDGHATIAGRSGEIGSDTDTAMLMGLRERSEAVMVGAGTVRTENYGRLLPEAERRQRREARGLAADPLAVVVSNRLELPWDAGLFADGAGQVLVFTASGEEPPPTSTPVEVVRHEGRVDLIAAMRHLRGERGVRALLCEGGPHLHGDLLAAGLVDEVFLTIGAQIGGGAGPRIVEGLAGAPLPLELRWLLREGDELYARYGLAGTGGA